MLIAFCDDEPLTVHSIISDLKKQLATHGLASDIKIYDSSAALIMDIIDNNISYDMYFLDIEMPVIDGITLAQKIRQINPRAIILIVSAHNDFGDKVCRVHADAYMYKLSYTDEAVLDIDCAIHKYLQRISAYTFSLSKEENRTVFVDDIVYIESLKRRIIVHMMDGTSIIVSGRYTLSYFEALDGFNGFYRISRSQLINCRSIASVDSDIKMRTGEAFRVRKDIINQVRHKFLMLLREDDFG